MKAINNPSRMTQYLYALLIAIALLCLIEARTNSISPEWDAVSYVDMAQSGIADNPNLVAPFAYRIGAPLMSRALSQLFFIPVETAFHTVTWGSALVFLLSIFTLSRQFTKDYRHALMPMIILALSFAHVKFPLFFYTLVDAPAYALIVIAFWALFTKRLALCLAVSSVGLLFKEFLAVPWLLLCLYLAYIFWRSRSRRDFFFLLVAIGIGASVIAIPRLYIPVVRTAQYIDPRKPSTLPRIVFTWLDGPRLFNIVYAAASYWLPTLLLLTRSRLDRLRTDLSGFTLYVIVGYAGLVLLLTVYGGTNIFIFVSYLVAAQAVILALLFRQGVGVAEMVYVIAVMLLYNKVMLFIPVPGDGFDAYIDFYGGWSSRVTLSTLIRFASLGVYVALAALLRAVIAKWSADGYDLII